MMVCAPRAASELLFFYKRLQLLDDLWPSASIILAGDGQVGQAAVRDLYVRAIVSGREFPTHQSAARAVIVPICIPGVSQNARRIEFGDVTVTLEFANSVNHNGPLLGGVAIRAVRAWVHGPDLHGTLRAGEPLFKFSGISERLENALRRSGNVDLADDFVFLGNDVLGGHENLISLFLSCLFVFSGCFSFARVLSLDECLEVVQAGRPEHSVLLEPGIHSAERFGIELIHAMAAFSMLAYKVSAAKQPQVL